MVLATFSLSTPETEGRFDYQSFRAAIRAAERGESVLSVRRAVKVKEEQKDERSSVEEHSEDNLSLTSIYMRYQLEYYHSSVVQVTELLDSTHLLHFNHLLMTPVQQKMKYQLYDRPFKHMQSKRSSGRLFIY